MGKFLEIVTVGNQFICIRQTDTSPSPCPQGHGCCLGSLSITDRLQLNQSDMLITGTEEALGSEMQFHYNVTRLSKILEDTIIVETVYLFPR